MSVTNLIVSGAAVAGLALVIHRIRASTKAAEAEKVRIAEVAKVVRTEDAWTKSTNVRGLRDRVVNEWAPSYFDHR